MRPAISARELYNLPTTKNDLEKCGQTTEDPRAALLNDLAIQLQKDQSEGYKVIVTGDMNEDLYKYGTTTQFMEQTELYNVIKNKHEEQAPPTYDRGSKCIDLIAAAETIEPSDIKRCGYLPFYEGIFSNHRAGYMDIEAEPILERAEPDLTKEIYKRFNTSNVNKCEKYVKSLLTHLEEAKIEEKIDDLEADLIQFLKGEQGNRESLIQRSKTLFNKTTQLMKSSEKRLKKRLKKNV